MTLDTKVTLAIPCYNGMANIGQTIESVIQQTTPPDEILVVDDGSTDESAFIAERYPVRVIKHGKNRGLGHTRNTTIANAEGDIVIFVDVDAVAAPDLVEVLLSGYDDPLVAGVGGRGIESNVNSLADRWRRLHASQEHGSKPRDVDHLFGLCMSYRIAVLRQLNGFNPDFRTNAEDVDIGLRINAAGYRLRYLPGAKVFHQRTDDEFSLKQAMVAWRISGFHAKRINNAHPWTMMAGTLRRLITLPLLDLIIERDADLARLSWQIGWINMLALRKLLAK